MADSLVATKLLPPWAHRPAVARPQLVARLRAGLAGPLTLLCAPAGFGKTSLALQALDGVKAVAWLSLEPDDSAPTRFAHYLLAAIARAAPELASALEPMQRSSPLDLRATMATLVNLLSERDAHLVLVLEDYHALDAPQVDEALGWLLAHQPPALRLLISSREDPQLPLARLRARGWLAELRGADLRFSAVEAAALITHLTGLALSDAQVAALVARTEGWAAGLQLASLTLREAADVDGLIAALRGTHRLLFDYLTDEVLLAQPPEIQQFLLQTSILDRLCGGLCDAVLDAQADSSRVLADLERANLFLIPLDAERRWYRYHHLFADLLRARLVATAGATLAALHQRAARWYTAATSTHSTAMMASAMHHALEGGADELAADLIEAHVGIALGQGDVALMASWLARLPPALFSRRPWLCLNHAWLLTLIGQHSLAEDRLRTAEQGFAGLPPDALAFPTLIAGLFQKSELPGLIAGSLAAISAYLSFARGDMDATIVQGRAALRQLPTVRHPPHAATNLVIGLGALEADQPTLAEQQLRLTVDCGPTDRNPYAGMVALGFLGELRLRQGQLDTAEALLQASLEAQRDPGGAPFPIAGNLCARLGLVRYERDDRASAALLLEQGRRCGELLANGWILEPASLTLAWLRHVEGDPTGAHALLDALEALAPRLERMVDPAQIHALRARIKLTEGDHFAVEAWLEQEEARQGAPYRPAQISIALTRARALVALGRPAEALALLEPLLAAAEAAGRVGHQIQLQVLRALALQAAGEQDQAVMALQQAVELGAARGYVRSFLDEGPAVAALLQRMKDEGGRINSYIARLLATFPGGKAITVGSDSQHSAPSPQLPALSPQLPALSSQPSAPSPQPSALSPQPSAPSPQPSALSPQPLAEPLTPREIELLQLIDAGLSNQAIAERLVLTVGTVKFYLSHLYGKLDVRGRTAALARARALGLLT